MSYELIWEPKGVYWRYYANVINLEVFNATMLAYGDARFDNLDYKLVNFLDVESMNMDENEVRVIANQHKSAVRHNTNVKNAIVIRTKNNKLANKFAELFSNSSWDVRVFDDLNAANDWIDRKPPFK